MNQKQQLRKEIASIKSQQSEDFLQTASKEVAHKVFAWLKALPNSAVVGLYHGMHHELRTTYLLQLLTKEHRHQILLPRVVNKEEMLFLPYTGDEDLELSKFGILEPKLSDKHLVPEVLIVPGVAFDAKGGRLGYGGGYYDRYIAKFGDKIVRKIALAYDFQLIKEDLPTEPHDFRVDELITEERHLTF